MAATTHAQQPPLIGRTAERLAVATLLAGAAQGQPGALIVHGEAGVGKTRLVREAVSPPAACQVLWSTCVHFGATSLPYSAVVPGLERWLMDAPDATRADVLRGLDDLASLMPGIADSPGLHAADGMLLPQFERAIARLATYGPTVLVADDFHSADPSSRDLLAYLLTGLRDERLAVVAIVRDEDRREGHPLHSWLADIRRLPEVNELHLQRLDEEGTAEQVEALLGLEVAPPDLGARIYRRSDGNPYLTELLVRGLSTAEPQLEVPVPEALREALLARWHNMTREARDVCRLLAVSGRPTSIDVLVRVADTHGHPGQAQATAAAVAQGIDIGILSSPSAGMIWFRHPLIAEVLTADIPRAQACLVHASYASILEDDEAPNRNDLAAHHELAGHPRESLRWSLLAAESAGRAQGDPERLEHLLRACRLWHSAFPANAAPQRPDPNAGEELGTNGYPKDYVHLLLRTASCAIGLGLAEQAITLIEQGLALTDAATSPGTTCRFLALKHRTLLMNGNVKLGVISTPLREAMSLAETIPDTPEHAIVATHVAWAVSWTDTDSARPLAAAALETARHAGDPEALVPALVVAAELGPEEADPLARLNEAFDVAASHRYALDMVHAVQAMANIHLHRGDYQLAWRTCAEHGAHMIRSGAPYHGRDILALGGYYALTLGHWAEARELLRPVLATPPFRHRGARNSMATLAARSGDLRAARRHLERSSEPRPITYNGTGSAPYAHAEVLIAERQPAAALELIAGQIADAAAADGRDSDTFLLLAARAFADLAQQGRDRQDSDALRIAEEHLERVRAAWSEKANKAFIPGSEADLIQAASKALYDAELSRGRNGKQQSQQWAAARQACTRAGLRWEEAIAGWHLAQALRNAGGSRTEIASALRDAYTIATEIGAEPLAIDLRTLAATVHISLEPIKPLETQTEPAPRSQDGQEVLTSREREVLSHVISGRTNSEIARALFISDKTVSVHISNILRKSGTSNRTEAAEWARRQSAPTRPGPAQT